MIQNSPKVTLLWEARTRMEYEINLTEVYNLLPNETSSQIMFKNLTKVGRSELTQRMRKSLLKKSIKTFPEGCYSISCGRQQ